MIRMLDGATAVGVSKVVKIPYGTIDNTVEAWFESLAATKITAVTIKLQGGMKDVQTDVIDNPVLAIGTTPERVANGAFNFVIDDVSYTKGAVAAGSVFTAAHVVSATKYGCINVYINAAGTIITKVPLATQAYASAALAHTAADAIPLNRKLCYLGRILINADAGDWTANTDDMTDASDLTTATFLSATPQFYDLTTHAFSADEITLQRAMFHQTDKTVRYIRIYLSALTGTGEVNVRYIPAMIH
jgi:hypothetical protein